MLEKHQNLKLNNTVTSTKTEKKEQLDNNFMYYICIHIHKW